ncbi:hypothetical protein D3C84_1073940 [compost metagenome]
MLAIPVPAAAFIEKRDGVFCGVVGDLRGIDRLEQAHFLIDGLVAQRIHGQVKLHRVGAGQSRGDVVLVAGIA